MGKSRLSCVLLAACTVFGSLYPFNVCHGRYDNPNLIIPPLSSNFEDESILAMLTDGMGFLWIATPKGLHKYDGVRVKTVGSTLNLAAPINHIVEDRSGDLVMASQSGLVMRLRRNTLSLSRLMALEETLLDLIRSPNGDIYIATQSGVRSLVDSQGVTSRKYLWTPPEETQFTSVAIYEDSGFWLASNTAIAFFSFKTQRATYKRLTRNDLALSNNEVVSAIQSVAGTSLLLGTNRGRLSVLTINRADKLVSKTVSRSDLPSITALSASPTSFWIATDKGLYQVDHELKELNKFSSENSALSNSHITSLHSSKFNLWVGTYRGIGAISYSSFEHFNKKNSAVANEIMDFESTKTGDLYIATYDGLFKLPDGRSLHRDLGKDAAGLDLKERRVMALSASSEVLAIGYRRSGLSLLDLTTGDVYEPSELTNFQITDLIHDREGALWVATFANGAHRIKGRVVTKLKLSDTAGISLNDPVFTLKESKNGTVYASTNSSLYAFNDKSEVFYPLPF